MGVSEKNEKVLENIARPGNRSPLFWWMLERHDEIVEFAVGRRMDWKGFVAGATELGITDTLGRPVKERNARETWRQVRLEKARLEEWRAENEAARAVKEAERLARRRIRELATMAGKLPDAGNSEGLACANCRRRKGGVEIDRCGDRSAGEGSRNWGANDEGGISPPPECARGGWVPDR